MFQYYAVVYDVLTSYGLASPMLSNVTDSAVMEENGVTLGSKTAEFLQLPIAFYCDIFMTYSSGKVITAAQSTAFFIQIEIEWNFMYAEDKKKVKQTCPGFTNECEKKGKKLKGGSGSKNKKASHGPKSKFGSSEKPASKEWDGTCNIEDQSNIAYVSTITVSFMNYLIISVHLPNLLCRTSGLQELHPIFHLHSSPAHPSCRT